MRAALSAAAGGMLALAALGCAPSYQVHTLVAPDAQLTSLHTFRVLPTPPPRDGRNHAGAYDPMVNNSITNRALRTTIMQAFEGRGYVADGARPDFLVAVYASAHQKLDVTAWDYGYPYWPRWGWPHARMTDRVTEYTEGTVIVDVLRTATRDLLWRGSGTARLTQDPKQDAVALQKVARSIVQRFPHEQPAPLVAAR